MEKITINGVCAESRILARYGGQNAEILFNKTIEDGGKYSFSAVFFIGEYDEKALRDFIGAEHIAICGDEKELFARLDAFFGIPRPLEIERKFLIEYPDTALLKSNPDCDFVQISQAYVSFGGESFRVRKRGRNGDFVYIKTKKTRLSDLARIEEESRITQAEFELFSRGSKTLSKTRWLIVYKNHYFELDVFPFWSDRALLEIELISEDEEFEIPPFLSVIREATNDREYRNFELCRKYGK